MAQQTFTNGDTAATVRSKLNNNANDTAAHESTSTNPHTSTLTQTNLTVLGTATFSDGNLVKSLVVDSGSKVYDNLQLLSGRRIDLTLSSQDITVAYDPPADVCYLRLDPVWPGCVWTAEPTKTCNGYGGRNYYEWTGFNSSSIGHLIVRVPEDFSAWNTSNAIVMQAWTDCNDTTSYVDVELFNNSTSIATASYQQGSGSWTAVTFDDSVLGSWSAGDLLKVKVTLAISTHATTEVARVGEIVCQYLPV